MSTNLDQRPTGDVVAAVCAGNDAVLAALDDARDALAALVDAVTARRGRVIYVGAGSAGRIAAVDAYEWGPTFGADDVVALVAGADLEPGLAQEAAEDDTEAGAAELRALEPSPEDTVIGVSASGSTPYVMGALKVASSVGALTAAIVSERRSPLTAMVQHPIELPVGPEVVPGSTRLKAGTAQKLALNAFSTALMVRRGRTYGNLMAGMRVANAKLRARAVRICVQAAGCTEADAAAALEEAGNDLPAAVVMLVAGVDAAEARGRLERSGGAVRAAAESSSKWNGSISTGARKAAHTFAMPKVRPLAGGAGPSEEAGT
jgi:N-acetylmuramic acid 6-phosphate etherase